MPSLHLTKVAMGCATLEALYSRVAARASGGVVPVHTRFRPKRAAELVGGSLFWIAQHRLVARQEILGFEETEEKRTIILCSDRLVAVMPRALRAHQGWRYLEDAPADLVTGEGAADLPPALARELRELALI